MSTTPARDTDGHDRPGSPSWWRNRSTPAGAPGRGRGRPALDPAHIVATALRLIDENGIHDFSLRMLAEELGSSTATLYRHFASKDEILVHAVDLALGRPDPSEPAEPGRWQDVLHSMGHQLHAILRQHPNILAPLMEQVPVGPNGLAQRERVLNALLNRGLPPALAARAFTAIGHYVIGFTAQQHGPAASPENGPRLAAFYRHLDATRYPAIARTAEALTTVPPAEEFDFGLRLLIVGLEHVNPFGEV